MSEEKSPVKNVLKIEEVMEFLDQEGLRRSQIASCHRLIDQLDQDIFNISEGNRQLEHRVTRMIESLRELQKQRVGNLKHLHL